MGCTNGDPGAVENNSNKGHKALTRSIWHNSTVRPVQARAIWCTWNINNQPMASSRTYRGTMCHTRLGTVVLCNILVVCSVFSMLGIKSIRSFWCLLCSLYLGKGSGPLDPRWQFVDCWLFDTHPSGALNQCSCWWCLVLIHWCAEVVIAWTIESWYGYGFYRALRGLLLSGLQVSRAKKGEAFLSWYAKISEFQSSPNWGLGLLD